MRYLIDLLLFSLQRRSKPNKYYGTAGDSCHHDAESTYGHENTEAQEQRLDEALLGDDEMFLQVLAGAHGVAISLLAVRYERGEY